MSIEPSDPQGFLEILRSERRDLLNRLRQTQFSTLKAGYSQTQVIPHASYSPWRDDAAFRALYERIRSFTMVDIYRCHELYSLAGQMRPVRGDFVEVGVWRGGTAALLAGAAEGRRIHLFDTFSGVAKADKERDTLYAGGEHADASENGVAELFRSSGLPCAIHAGVFPDDTLTFLPDAVSLAHIDVDTYASAKDAFVAIWPRVQPGGVVVFDDYGFLGCEGVTEAVNELRASVKGALFVHNLNGHGLFARNG